MSQADCLAWVQQQGRGHLLSIPSHHCTLTVQQPGDCMDVAGLSWHEGAAVTAFPIEFMWVRRAQVSAFAPGHLPPRENRSQKRQNAVLRSYWCTKKPLSMHGRKYLKTNKALLAISVVSGQGLSICPSDTALRSAVTIPSFHLLDDSSPSTALSLLCQESLQILPVPWPLLCTFISCHAELWFLLLVGHLLALHL